MSKKHKHKNLLDAPPSYTYTFSAEESGDFHALSLLAVYYHSCGRSNKFLEVAEAFQNYTEAKKKSEKT